MSKPGNRHYSETYYEDAALAEQFDESRFGGPIGEYVAALQERAMAEYLGDLHGLTALDVGAGTARASIILAKLGARVTALDRSQEMLRVGRRRGGEAAPAIQFVAGDAAALMFPEQCFDLVASFRVLMHVQDWRQCLGEMCRLSHGRVVFDFPALPSAATLQVVVRRLFRNLGANAESYRVISVGAVRQVLEAQGFCVTRLHRQFVLPIGLHKLLSSRRFTEASESALNRIGLLRLLGSPVMVVGERCGQGDGVSSRAHSR